MLRNKLFFVLLLILFSGVFQNLCSNQKQYLYGTWQVKTKTNPQITFFPNKNLQIININSKIFGTWKATKRYLYLRYTSILNGNIKKEYYKKIVFRIVLLSSSKLVLQNRYTLRKLILEK